MVRPVGAGLTRTEGDQFMDGKQKGFTLIEILVVVTIIGVLAGLVVVLIPKGQFEAKKTECMSNVRGIVSLLTATGGLRFPEHGGSNLILYLVKKGDIEGEDNLKTLFCPGDMEESYDKAGGAEAFKDLDLKKKGEYDHLTSYAGRDQLRKNCAAKKGGKTVVLVCDDSEDHHDAKGLVVGLSNGAAKYREKVDDYGVDAGTPIQVGEGSAVEELDCLKAD
ncbi:MAG: type II secretion system protein [Planctomycetota bacterium]|jgi:prepilin-type N-terminal cleavage/methylation domain-containing protein